MCKRTICIISLSPVSRDARVLRQVKFLSPHYSIIVIGYGSPHPSWSDNKNIRWISVNNHERHKISSFALLLMGKLFPQAYEWWYWRKKPHKQALEYARSIQLDAIYANDWDSLPIAVKGAHSQNAIIVFDAHEYTIGQYQYRLLTRLFKLPAIKYLLEKNTQNVHASITVEETIAERYRREFALDPIVVLNAPEYNPAPERTLDQTNIKLIHHGGALRIRRLEAMIETIILADQRYSLTFMLVGDDKEYIQFLRETAKRLTPGRVHFIDPVSPEEIVNILHKYDIGFFILKPVHESYLHALPNKFFDFVMAGLAVCIGPSPAMSNLARNYGFGCVAPTFDPLDVAALLNHTESVQWESMRQRALEAAKELNAEKEMDKVLILFDHLLDEVGN